MRCVVKAEKAAQIEQRLAVLLDVELDELRDYLRGNVRAGGARRTGVRFVRGTHSGTYIRDPEGTDLPPAGYSVPG
jgi:hypothetical protein